MRAHDNLGQDAGDPVLGLADLNIARRGHTATQLADGRILIVGGENVRGLVKESEVFDPCTRGFLISAELLASRRDHTATKMEGGRVLVIGGRNHDFIDSTEIFDSLNGAFGSGPRLNRARAGHSATTLSDGRILIAGGDDHGTAEIFDPESQTFTLLEGRLSSSRAFHSAILLNNGTVLITGGLARDNTAIRHGEVFDPESSSFSVTRNSMRAARVRPTLRVLPDGKVQVIGGDSERSMEMFNTEGGRFTAYAQFPPGSKSTSQILRAQTRAGLIHAVQRGDLNLQASLPRGLDKLLDRSEHSLTDMPRSGQAVVAGGKSGVGRVLKSVVILSSSSATVTTDKTDYAPGETVIITGSGWPAGETVDLTLHRDSGADDTVLTAVADTEGSFTNAEYVIQDSDLNVTFLLTAVGQTSSCTAQTTFTDAGPTNPTAQSLPYSQDFSALPYTGAGSSIYPVGWQGWTLASGSSSSFRTNAPAADENLIAGGSASTTQGGVLNYNGKIGILATGSGGTDPSLCFAIDTTGSSNVMVSFDIMTIRNPHNGTTNTRINQVDLQYRVGTAGSFTSVTGNASGIYQNNSTLQTAAGVTTPQNSEAKSLTLPAACDNQSYVQLRWVQRDASGAGARPSFAVDNISVCSTPGPAGAVTGSGTVCQGQPGVSYSVPASANATSYVWSYSGAGATINGTGDSITIDFSLTATSGDLSVNGTNACGNGAISPVFPITIQSPTSAPTVTSPVCSGATFVAGTSTEAEGTVIEVLVDEISVGATTVSSGAWTKSNLVPLNAGQVITANATAAGKCPSASSIGVTVNAPPVVSVGQFSDVCINSPAFELSTGSPAGGTYTGPGVSSGVFNPATAGVGTHTIAYTFTDANGCTNSATASITVLPLPIPFVVSGGGSYCAGGAGAPVGLSSSELGITYQLKKDGSNVGAPLSGTGAAISFGNQTMAGTYTVQAINTTTGCSTMMTGSAIVAVSASPVVNVYAGPPSQSIQYSDPIEAVTIKAMDADSAGTSLIASTWWKKNGGAPVLGLPSGFMLGAGQSYAGPPGSSSWTISGNALLEPATYIVRLIVTDNTGCSGSVEVAITVTQEDARAVYTGLTCYSTPSSSSTSALVTLVATVQDITGVTGDPDYDAFGGDIRNARVSFVNRDAPGQPAFPGCADLTPVLLDPSDQKTGTVSCITTLAIPGSDQSTSFTIGIVVSNYYTRNDSFDDAIVNVYKPGMGFLGGGGYLINVASAGAYAGTQGARTNFGFNAKAKTPKVLQGHINIILRKLVDGDWRIYQIKSNAIDSLTIKATSPSTGTGQLISKANLTDITDPLNPISLGGNYLLQVTVTDNGEPGSWDKVGITLWNGSVLLFSSNWSGAPPKTVEQTIASGSLQIR